jgi:hypothetical protein
VVLDDSNILQADATVIAGLLILLTVAYALEPRSRQEVAGEFAFLTVMRISRLVIAVVIPFSLSAILMISANFLGSYNMILSGIMLTTVGFAALAIGITWLLWRNVRRGASQDKDLKENK